MIEDIHRNLLDDFIVLLPSETPEDEKEPARDSARGSLRLAFARLSKLDPKTDPLVWWPRQKDLAQLFPLVKMLLAVPASSAENERSFSSASFTLDNHRYRTAVSTFRQEHRVRRFLVSGNNVDTQEGRRGRLNQMNRLLEHYSRIINARIREEDA
jgi:hypothetical protein